MERELKIVFAVSDEGHAEKIRKDIIEAIKQRTTLYFIGNLKSPKKSSDKLHRERMKF